MKTKTKKQTKCYKTLKLRIKDKHSVFLLKLSREVNFVFNYVNNLSFKHIKRKGQFLSAFDIADFTKGAGKEGLTLHSQTVQAITEEYVKSRVQHKKIKLNWRVSNKKSSKYSLGWIPFKASAVDVKHGQVKYGKVWLSLWDSYSLEKYTDKVKFGCFTEDSRGRWYVSLVVEVKGVDKPNIEDIAKEKTIGIDLGLKDFATISNGTVHEKVTSKQFYRNLEKELGNAQRAKNPTRIKSISAKIKNQRLDELHKLSSMLVKKNQAIFVGDVSSSELGKTKLAKSVYDAGWSMFRNMLEYKCKHAGIYFYEVDERNTTQRCSCCQLITANSPKGLGGLGIRKWECSHCNTVHDRDTNAAINILLAGHCQLLKNS